MYINIGGSWHEYAYVYDGLGEITGLMDDTSGSTLGTEVVTYQYDAWGNVIGHTNSPSLSFQLWNQNPLVYKGYWYDWDTGLYYLDARYYNPTLGQFLSEDPVSPQLGNARSYNEYAYVGNNPIIFVDPQGTWGEYFPKPPSAKTEKHAAIATAITVGVAGSAFGLSELLIGSSAAESATSPGGFAASVMRVLGRLIKGTRQITNEIINLNRTGSALKIDILKPVYENGRIVKEVPFKPVAHGFSDLVDNYAGYATKTTLKDGAKLYQLAGDYNGVAGRFEWIVDGGKVTHRMFVSGGSINGRSIVP